jgi:hypothetical protein
MKWDIDDFVVVLMIGFLVGFVGSAGWMKVDSGFCL